jgi:hypothetical protein
VTATNSTFQIDLPNYVNSSRFVCFQPAADTLNAQPKEVCKWLPYESVPLATYVVPHVWVSG